MSDEPTLSEALARAQARVASFIDTPAPPVPEASTVALLRTAALAHGIAPDDLERSFLDGGPLADLVRAVLGTEVGPPPKPRGRPQKFAETWLTFVSVVSFMRRGYTQEAAIGQVAEAMRAPETTIRDRFTRTRDRDGISVESVPHGIEAFFSRDPRPKRPNAKR